jgi:hypothetical protein
MTLLCGFLAPVLLVTCVAWRAFRHVDGPMGRRVPLVAVAAALVPVASTVWMVARAPQSGLVQVAWTGVEAVASGRGLNLGGPRDLALLGWPSGRFFPQVSID